MAGPTVQGTVLRQTMPAPAPAPDYWEEALKQQMQRLDEINKRAPRYTPEQIQQRRDQNQREYELGIMGMLSGNEGLKDVGGTVLKQAMGMRQPKVTEKGSVDQITGEFTYDPDYERQQVQNRISVIQQAAAAAAERRGLAHDRNALAQTLAAMRGQQHEGAGVPTHTGYDPATGDRVVTGKDGLEYTISVGAGGKPVLAPYGGSAVPKAAWEKQVGEAAETNVGVSKGEAILATARANPDAFSMKAAVIAGAPGWAQGWASKAANLTPAQRQVRADIFKQASIELNKLYGASQSAMELAKASGWSPDPRDDVETVLTKLQSALNDQKRNAAAFAPGVQRAAAQRAGTPAAGKADPLGYYGNTPPAPKQPAAKPPPAPTVPTGSW